MHVQYCTEIQADDRSSLSLFKLGKDQSGIFSVRRL